jgi:hypothetical protein
LYLNGVDEVDGDEDPEHEHLQDVLDDVRLVDETRPLE